MEEPMNGFDLLERLQKQNGKATQRFDSLTRYLSFKAREKGIPFSGQFELTPLCNFDCKMCYVHLDSNQLRDYAVLPADTWKKIMYQAWEAGMMEVTLTGGECFTYPGFEELFLYLHSLGCEVAVLTNGFLLDDDRIHFFQGHMPARIQVTLYGWNDDVYERVTGRRAFGTIYRNIQKANESGLPLHINITPSVYLGEDVLETIKVASTGTLDLSGWDTSKLKAVGEMFLHTKIQTIDLSGWTFDSITNDLWEGANSGIYYETGNDQEAMRGFGSMFKNSTSLTTVYVSQAGLDSYEAAAEKGVNTQDMWTKTKANGFTVK